MLKTLQSRSNTCARLHAYLTKHDRSLALDLSENLCRMEAWGREMDSTRKDAGKDAGRHYYHFVLSPDPSDAPSLEALRSIATAWARRCYPDGQWAICYHDDNEHGILHAHVVLNAYQPETGKMVHRSPQKVHREANTFNELCRKAGVGSLPDLPTRPAEPSAQQVRAGLAERAIETKGGTSWKARMRAAADEARKGAGSFEEFAARLRERGADAYVNKRGQVVFVPAPEWEGFPCKGSKLGASYELSALVTSFTPDIGAMAQRWRARATGTLPIPAFSGIPKARMTYADLLERRMRPRRGARAQQLAGALQAIRQAGVRSLADLDARIEEAYASLAGGRADLARLEDAARVAEDALAHAHAARSARSASAKERESMWLAERGLGADADLASVEAMALEARSAADAMATRLDAAQGALKALRSARDMIALEGSGRMARPRYSAGSPVARGRGAAQGAPMPAPSRRQEALKALAERYAQERAAERAKAAAKGQGAKDGLESQKER